MVAKEQYRSGGGSSGANGGGGSGCDSGNGVVVEVVLLAVSV